MNVELKKLSRSIYIAILATILAVIALIWVFSRSFVTLKVIPYEAELTIDDKAVQSISSGTFRLNLSPENHNVKIEADGYVGLNTTLSLKRGFMKQILFELKTTPKPVEISNGAEYIVKGSDFNDGYYLGNGGKTLYKLKVGLTEDGTIEIIKNTPITDARLTGVKEIIWSPTKELALLRKAGEMTIFDFKKYDFVNQTELPWGKDVGAVAWSPDNSKIAYYYATNGEKSLVFSNIANTEVTRIANFSERGIENPILKWSPDSQWLLIIPRNSDRSKNKIYLFNTYSRTFKTLTDNGGQLDASFSPNGNKILYGTYQSDPESPVFSALSIMNIDGSDKRTLGIFAEISKTAWEKDSKNVVIATYDSKTKNESIFKFDTDNKKNSGFIIRDFGKIFINTLFISDDEKMILYQTSDGIFAIKVE
ncbi:MAG: hypothetical protein WC107_00120 [Patescibacteria group bacterium]